MIASRTWRLGSPDGGERQFALLNLAILEAAYHGTRLYVGVCDCAQAQRHGILILSSSSVEEACVFCGRPVTLMLLRAIRMALLKELWLPMKNYERSYLEERDELKAQVWRMYLTYVEGRGQVVLCPWCNEPIARA